jgi:acetate kinase
MARICGRKPEPRAFKVAAIFTINAGSSTLKYAAFDRSLMPLLRGQIEGAGNEAVTQALEAIEGAGVRLASAHGIGHRIVHGGARYIVPTIVDDVVLGDLDELRRLAPLHLPYGLGALRQLRTAAPKAVHVACFDTAFHAGRSTLSTRLPLPRRYHERGYQRYGFHGLSYEHVVRSLDPLPRRLIAAHLGSGSSMCAILDGKSAETTMGYSTADGLVMGTRTGAIDPGVLIALMRDEGLGPDALEDLLYRQSGLLGVSAQSADMRELLASSKPDAAEAVELYCYHAARHAASLAASMGGVDAIAFTGGIGENAALVRQKIMERLQFLDIAANRVHVIKADEELTIARHVRSLVG